MPLEVVNASLLDAPEDFAIVQCISADCAMGITPYSIEIPCLALDIRRRYPSIDVFCKSQDPSVGDVLVYHGDDGRIIFNLVTKWCYYKKPTYGTMEFVLSRLRNMTISDPDRLKLAIPKLGSGLDKLDWDIVLEMVEDILVKSGIHVVLYDFKPGR